ncbi:MAG: VOC family protein [Pseudomonadota bacterium]|nr:VOC family protein [Pseudomonadota bacterium]
MADQTVSVRYMVDDVQAALDWYTKHLGFEVISNHAPPFADVQRGSLRLLLSGPASSAGRPMSDGEQPRPGGWNRIHLLVDDLAFEVERLKKEGAKFRNDIVSGPGGSQILLVDPSGNLVELFQPARR